MITAKAASTVGRGSFRITDYIRQWPVPTQGRAASRTSTEEVACDLGIEEWQLAGLGRKMERAADGK